LCAQTFFGNKKTASGGRHAVDGARLLINVFFGGNVCQIPPVLKKILPNLEFSDF